MEPSPHPHPNKFLSITENRVYKDNQALADNDADVYLSTPLLDKVKAWNSVCLESRYVGLNLQLFTAAMMIPYMSKIFSKGIKSNLINQ